ncbi:hypothetical protein BDQ94DRAFT_154833 [Aspergillus welwitschiae]|uniref:Uncharacterized protein n=1 Tax=Aspergillus welwitschiae TaxID=1341132 RepID=A0A3F3PJ06_9EURO|nr:hypothetical protein BDQ94DRAFT_154833 [Aspergillus welwitschiae]RDH26921.1 hypothetical protein BDQ94DRAFT_154833 [Aspergillus welwitschiae]
MFFGADGSFQESRLGSFGTYQPKCLALQLQRNPDISGENTKQGTLVPLFHTGHIRVSPGFPSALWEVYSAQWRPLA